ncbi:ribbon-helix-helix domain-containing protein [Candidatus Woesearchaeota archaeon]|nr:ribbon-helix-helix domain-containing protein [Candidatus Woesearchaeota archaeon]
MEKIPVTVKYEGTLLKQIDKLAHENFETRSEFIRDITTDAVKRKLEMKQLRDLAIKRWVDGIITADQMTKILGEDESEKVVLIRKTLRQSVERGIELGSKLRK